MSWKRLYKALLFPHIVILIALLPISIVLLIGLFFVETTSVLAYIAYFVSAYTLTVWCCKIPYLIKFFKRLKTDNKYIRRWLQDARLRVNVSLYGLFFWNIAYALFQLGLGFVHKTFWFYSLSIYYFCLAFMRFFLMRHSKKYAPGEKMKAELIRARNCGWTFLVMNMALSVIVFFMIYWNRTFEHHQITAIAMAAYTFTSLTVAIINSVKFRKYNSPVFSASKAISLTAACVSMLALTSTLMTAFGDGTMGEIEQKWMLGGTGAAVCIVIMVTAIYMIVQSTKKMKNLQTKEHNNGQQ